MQNFQAPPRHHPRKIPGHTRNTSLAFTAQHLPGLAPAPPYALLRQVALLFLCLVVPRGSGGQRQMEERLGLGGLTLSFLDLPLERVGKKMGQPG